MVAEKLSEESALSREAFEYYYSLGKERSFDKVALKFGRTCRTVSAWANKNDWSSRVTQRDVENGGSITGEIATFRLMIVALIKKFERDLKKGKIEVESIEDLERLIKLDLLLAGKYTDISEIRKEVELPDDFRNLLDTYIEQAEQENSQDCK